MLYPGEVEFLREQDRRKNGIPVEDATWDKLRALAGEYGLAAELGLGRRVGMGSDPRRTRGDERGGRAQGSDPIYGDTHDAADGHGWLSPGAELHEPACLVAASRLARRRILSADFYIEIARVLEAGKFHLAFFDDRLAMPDRYGNDHAHTVEHGIRCVKLDPIVVLMVMGAATTRLGLGATCSTTYFEPFDVARRFATLDLMTDGRVDAPDEPVRALGDPDELDRACANLLSNAVKYTPEGQAITISLARLAGEIVLTCADEGIGISVEDQAQLFSEFFRSTNPVALAQPGTGLGLAIVRRIVARHEGRIEVESELGAGSTFRMFLPATD